MIRWSLSAELFSAILLVLLMLSYYGQRQAPTAAGARTSSASGSPCAPSSSTPCACSPSTTP